MNKETYQANLRTWIERADNVCWEQGKDWYRDAQDFVKELASQTGVDALRVAAVVSALSPNNRWERNKIDAKNLIHAFVLGQDMNEIKVCTYNANKAKAIRILEEGVEVLQFKSPKTYSFARNVGELDAEYVTIDKWHLRACETDARVYTKTRTSVTPKQYEQVQDWTSEVAKEYNLKGYEFQAIVWVTIKNHWEL